MHFTGLIEIFWKFWPMVLGMNSTFHTCKFSKKLRYDKFARKLTVLAVG